MLHSMPSLMLIRHERNNISGCKLLGTFGIKFLQLYLNACMFSRGSCPKKGFGSRDSGLHSKFSVALH